MATPNAKRPRAISAATADRLGRMPSYCCDIPEDIILDHVEGHHSPHDHEHFYRSTSIHRSPSSRPSHHRDAESEETLHEGSSDPEKNKNVDYPDDLVTFDGDDDPENPMNWSTSKRFRITMVLGFLTMGATLASSIFSAAFEPLTLEFNIGIQVATLGIALFILAFALGPIIWGPISEWKGRRLSVLPAYFVFICFTAATAVSKDIQSVMITRFFGGVMASAPVSNVGGALADMWPAKTRGIAVVFYSFAVVGGPTLGPLIGNAAATSYLGWRWTLYLSIIFSSTVFLLALLFVPETYAPVILTEKARRLRLETRNYALHSKQETQDLALKVFLQKTITRPIYMLTHETILFCVCMYNGFAYAVLYGLFEVFPIAFAQGRGWSPVVASLPFLAVLVGVFIAGGINILYSTKVYAPAMTRNKGKVEPELRLIPMILGGAIFPIGFFWFGWTQDSHWINQVLAAGLIGCAFLLIFQTGINYLIDVYTVYAASALSANTFIRSLFAAGISMAIRPMYNSLGVNWGTSLLGFVSLLLAAVPVLFYFFGKRLRARSHMASSIAGGQ